MPRPACMLFLHNSPPHPCLKMQAVVGGSLCVAAAELFGLGRALHPRRARSGLLLGGLLAAGLYGFAGALCALSPYCLA